jgi:peptidoglycan-associated lipoprotein
MLIAMGMTLVLAMVLLSGCGGKKAVVDEPAIDPGTQIEDLPPPPVAEDDSRDPEPQLPDYGSMEPAEYGVEDIFFAFDAYDLDDESMAILSSSARMLREAGTTVLISGHCDERGTLEYNLALGEKRANAVRDYLISLGVPGARLRVTSYGENRPFAQGSNESAWAQNRRAHFARP